MDSIINRTRLAEKESILNIKTKKQQNYKRKSNTSWKKEL